MDINAIPYQQHLPQSIRHPSGGQAASSSTSTSKPVFEFTKRKKWDDLLLSELHLTILFILSLSSQQSSSKILFTGYNTALSDVLGYNDTELVDSAFGDIMNERDGQVWQSIVDDAVRAQNPGTIGMFVRLKRKPVPPPLAVNTTPLSQFSNAWPPSPVAPTPPPPQPDVLFEIRGHVHFSDPEQTSHPEPLCVLATATPYPSTVSNALNSFLEQKIEHERLLKRVRTLQARSNDRLFAQQDPSLISDPNQNYVYPHLAHSSQFNLHHFPLPIPSSINPSDPRFSSHHSSSTDRSPLYSQTASSVQFPPGPSPLTSSNPHSLPQIEEDEESRRKKLKKAPQYVCITCGRTDSPEWRKGPQGPKTLCNACGLRWAKKSRKLEGGSDTSKMVT